MQSFLSIQGKAFPSLQPRPRPYNHAHSYEWAFSIYPAQPGLPLPFLAGAQTPHPQRPGLPLPTRPKQKAIALSAMAFCLHKLKFMKSFTSRPRVLWKTLEWTEL